MVLGPPRTQQTPPASERGDGSGGGGVTGSSGPAPFATHSAPSIPGKFETVLYTGPKEEKAFGARTRRFKHSFHDLPGPGAYHKPQPFIDPNHASHSRKGFGQFASSNRRWTDPFSTGSGPIAPGPGAYHSLHSNPSLTTNHSSHAVTSVFKPAQTSTSAAIEPEPQRPGPGHYDPKPVSGARHSRSGYGGYAEAALRSKAAKRAAAAESAAAQAALNAALKGGNGIENGGVTIAGTAAAAIASNPANSSVVTSTSIVAPPLVSTATAPFAPFAPGGGSEPLMHPLPASVDPSILYVKHSSPIKISNAAIAAAASGSVAIDSSDDSGEQKLQFAPDVNQSFLSTAKRFGIPKSIAPAPGSYDPAPAQGFITRDESAQFRSKSIRAPILAANLDVPGPGTYESPSVASEAVLAIKMPVYSSVFKPSASDRFGQPIVRRTRPDAIPGPGTYDIKQSALHVASKVTRQSKREKEKRSLAITGGGARGLFQKQQNDGPTASAAAPNPSEAEVVHAVASPYKSALGRAIRDMKGGSPTHQPAMTQSQIKPPGPAYYSPSLINKTQRSFHLNRNQTFVK